MEVRDDAHRPAQRRLAEISASGEDAELFVRPLHELGELPARGIHDHAFPAVAAGDVEVCGAKIVFLACEPELLGDVLFVGHCGL